MPETQRRPTLRSYTSGNTSFYFAVGLGITIVVISAILGSYRANLQGQIDALDGQLQTTEDSRNKDQEQTLLAVSQQSALMSQLLSGKIYWSQAFGYLQQVTQGAVTFTTLSASVAKNTITFHGTADSYATVAHQIAAFTGGTGVTDVAVTSVKAVSQGGVDFDGQLTINPKVMLNKPISK